MSEHHRRVAKNLSSRKGDNNRRDKSEGGNEDYVDLRVTEEPEKVLVQNRIAAFGRIEEVRID